MDMNAAVENFGQTPAGDAYGYGVRELSGTEIDAVGGGFNLNISGYDGAAAIMGTVGFASLFTPIGPITAGIAIGSAGGLAISQAAADLQDS